MLAREFGSGMMAGAPAMLTLYSYPELFGVADNNGYGLKVVCLPPSSRGCVRP